MSVTILTFSRHDIKINCPANLTIQEKVEVHLPFKKINKTHQDLHQICKYHHHKHHSKFHPMEDNLHDNNNINNTDKVLLSINNSRDIPIIKKISRSITILILQKMIQKTTTRYLIALHKICHINISNHTNPVNIITETYKMLCFNRLLLKSSSSRLSKESLKKSRKNISSQLNNIINTKSIGMVKSSRGRRKT